MNTEQKGGMPIQADGDQPFQALVVDKVEGDFRAGVRTMRLAELPDHDVLIRVLYSSVNYKDALACAPTGNIVKTYPFVPGIDLAGVVVRSRDERYREGDEVLVTGYELGVAQFGGFSQYAQVSGSWIVKRPPGMTLQEAMILGTAGFTAALSVHALQESGVAPDRGPVLVTGASGGVGSVSVAILAKLGYEVVASTGKPELVPDLLTLGASRVITREALIPEQPRSLDKQVWAGAIDCVGGKTLSSLLSSVKYAGAVAMSGLTGGVELTTSVFPFILRGIRLIGIDSVFTPMDTRLRIWERLASDYKPAALSGMYTEIGLEQIADYVPLILQGRSRGRLLVRL
ncbi:acryloyl-CoA reductase [Paenibacillus sp. HJGM_3]|uniref:acrylyl-CoA reductase family protein n=1 Tax=Paenibacillus sp. HJGM_3 TaxID=3379816 RepID=UPI00385D0721